jgi:hypothetical protein
MRALVLAVLVCGIIALLLVAGCTFNLKNADGSLNKSFSTNPGTGADTGNSAGIGGGTGAGKSSGNSVQKPSGSTTKSEKGYQFYLSYIYRDKTIYPRYEKNVDPCGKCDKAVMNAVKSDDKIDESHVELIMQGPLGGSSYPVFYNPIFEYQTSSMIDPRIDISGNNNQRVYEWTESYSPSKEEISGCWGNGVDKKSGHQYETVTSGHCSNIQVRIPSVNDKDMQLIVEPSSKGCSSDETYKKHYWGPTIIPDEVFTKKSDSQGEYHIVCAPQGNGVTSAEADEYFFSNSKPGEQTTRDFSVDEKGVYRIHCSGSKFEVVLPACTDTGCRSDSCWPGGAATRNQERILDVIISPADVPVMLPTHEKYVPDPEEKY